MKTREIIHKYNLDKEKWTAKSLQGVLHFCFPIGEEAIKPLKDYYGDCYRVSPFFVHDDCMEWYWNNNDMTRLRKSFIKKVNSNPKFLYKFLKDWKDRLEIFNKVMKQIDKTDLTKLNDEKLMGLYYEWYNAYINEYGLAIGLQDAFSMRANDFLIPHFKRVIPKNKFDKYYLDLVNPTKESFIKREYRDRIKLLLDEGSLNEHVKKNY